MSSSRPAGGQGHHSPPACPLRRPARWGAGLARRRAAPRGGVWARGCMGFGAPPRIQRDMANVVAVDALRRRAPGRGRNGTVGPYPAAAQPAPQQESRRPAQPSRADQRGGRTGGARAGLCWAGACSARRRGRVSARDGEDRVDPSPRRRWAGQERGVEAGPEHEQEDGAYHRDGACEPNSSRPGSGGGATGTDPAGWGVGWTDRARRWWWGRTRRTGCLRQSHRSDLAWRTPRGPDLSRWPPFLRVGPAVRGQC